MKKTVLKIAMIFVLATLFTSCYPGNDVSVEDLDTTSTFYKASDFTNAPKSAMLYWDVAQLKAGDGDDIDYKGEIDDEILNTTLDNLVDLYGVDNVWIFTNNEQPIPVPSNPNVKVIKRNDDVPDVDAAILPAIVLREKTSVGIIYPPCLPGWWGWWCYPPMVGVSSYGVGTVVLSMSTSFNGTITEPSWTGVMRGLLSSSASSNSNRTISGIDQAFEQSPYLN
ncbi:MAG: hypothetical protein L3J34_10275 [Flavobacteriaceae bacterium]|nr:hypothetical protein [Flavobacteriaceae bacterium]